MKQKKRSAPHKKYEARDVAVTAAVSLFSTAMSIVNKLAIRSFPHSSAISLLQTAFTLVGVTIYMFTTQDTSSFTLQRSSPFFPTAVFTALSYITNFQALKYLNVATVTLVHNVDLIVVAFMDFIMFGRRFQVKTILSLVVLLIGAVLYCFREIQVSFVGYLWMFLHILAHESQSIWIKRISSKNKYTSIEITFYNSLLTCPIMLSTFLAKGGSLKVFSALATKQSFWAYISAILSLVLTNLRFLSLKSLSVTAYAALNIVNKIPASILSVFLFHDRITPLQIIGYILAFTGAFFYAVFGQDDTFEKKSQNKPSHGKYHHK